MCFIFSIIFSQRPVPEVAHLEECLKVYIYTIHMAQGPKEKMEEALGLGLRVKSQVRWEKVKRKTKKQWAKSISQIKKDTDGWCEYSSPVVASKPVSSL